MERMHAVLLGTGVLLLGFVFYAALPTLTGESVVLQLAPVDPTDIFYGEYMTIRYAISRIDQDLPKDRELKQGDTVYVSLERDTISRAVAYSHTKPTGLFIKGKVSGNIILFGVEKFYIPEGSGRWIRGDDYTALLKIDSTGRATIKEIRKNGERIEFRYDGTNDFW